MVARVARGVAQISQLDIGLAEGRIILAYQKAVRGGTGAIGPRYVEILPWEGEECVGCWVNQITGVLL